jgi:hypothetical protein
MYMLPPRRMHNLGNVPLTGSGVEEDGWLIPLVDRRYFWQWMDTSNILLPGTLDSDANPMAWDDLIDRINNPFVTGGGDESVIHDAISAAYGFANNKELVGRAVTNLAVYMDAVAASVGMRCVFDAQTETLNLQSAAKANEKYLENLELGVAGNKGDELLAGGFFGSDGVARNIRPRNVSVSFPRYVYRKPQVGNPGAEGRARDVRPEDDVWEVEVPFAETDVRGEMDEAGEDVSSMFFARTTKMLYSSAEADFTPPPDTAFTSGEPLYTLVNPREIYPDAPNNETALNLLAQQAADDYYRWLRYSYDRSYLGLTEWEITGIDDWVWYHPAYRNPEGGYSSFTRVSSMPYNFGSSEMLNQLTGVEDSWYAIAVNDWEENATVGNYPAGYPRVKCRACDWDEGRSWMLNQGRAALTADDAWAGPIGNEFGRGEDFWIYLPRTTPGDGTVFDANLGWQTQADPAVYAGDVIQWKLDDDSVPVCISEYLHQGRIRDVKMIGLNRVPRGWSACDGSERTGASGTFNVVDMSPEDGLGHPTEGFVGAMPRHTNGLSESIQERGKLHNWDAMGAQPIFMPDEGLAQLEYDDGSGAIPHHVLRVAPGHYVTVALNFIQRYK